MEHSQPVSRDTPSNVRDILLSVLRFGTWFAETIRASGRVRRANRPDTRLLLTSAKISFKYVLLCSGYPHKTFAAVQKNGKMGCQSPSTALANRKYWVAALAAAFFKLHNLVCVRSECPESALGGCIVVVTLGIFVGEFSACSLWLASHHVPYACLVFPIQLTRYF